MIWSEYYKLLVAVSVLVTLFLSGAVGAVDGEDAFFIADPDAEKFALILVGATIGEEDEARLFSLATELNSELATGYGYKKENVKMFLGSRPKGFGGLATLGPCRAENIQAAIRDFSKKIKSRDQFSVFLFGYGSGSRESAKFNIVGPDITGEQFSSFLSTIEARSAVIINTTSASYDFSRALSGVGRVVLSATRSSSEKYDTKFPEYLVEGIISHRADRDKNQKLSILEAFLFATDRVQTYFRDSGQLATEHSALDDNGDGIFSLELGVDQSDGRLAEIAYLDAGVDLSESLSQVAARLKTQLDNLERSVFLLRSQKPDMSEQQYWQRMEPLLIELAEVNQEFNRELE